ncbi:YqhA family protein [Bosea sp. (in: a-proteobacteria)]|uniref:YqhA family protein n=1 Tax=Bosea sp. (in: a-proteobacteria) TaxID=1871050 RepID=UPI0027347D0F|nr:YqhA family protein [Bosea sp. (in: a-proteobacteria)]MDP3407146.1 YqhA family protein [Bosea sp. (in: a-proteobacteria)]
MRAASLAIRAIIALAALGMMSGALVLLGEAGANVVAAARAMLAQDHAKSAVSLIMKTVDECLFAIILMLLGTKVLASFVLNESVFATHSLPGWIKPSEMGELKSTFCQAILVFLIVDFATDMASVETPLDASYLVLPAAVLIIAGALRLMPHGAAATGHGHPSP